MFFGSQEPPFEGAVCVAKVTNPVEASIIRDLLEQNGIPSLKRATHGIDPLPVLAGSSVFGEDIFVPGDAQAEAKAIIDGFLMGKGEKVAPEEPQA